MTPESVRIPASPIFIENLKKLGELTGSFSYTETVRRAVADQLAIRECLRDSKEIMIRGKNPKGVQMRLILP